MYKNKFCVSKRQIFVVSLVFILGCFIVLINYINKANLYTQSRASDLEFDKIIVTPIPTISPLPNILQTFPDGLFHGLVSVPYFGGYYIDKINHYESPPVLGSSDNPEGSVYGLFLELCNKYNMESLESIDLRCNFTTVVKTGAVGGIHKCEVFSSMPNALSWISGGFVSDEYASPHITPSPFSDIKTLAIAILPKTDSVPSPQQIITDLCPNQ